MSPEFRAGEQVINVADPCDVCGYDANAFATCEGKSICERCSSKMDEPQWQRDERIVVTNFRGVRVLRAAYKDFSESYWKRYIFLEKLQPEVDLELICEHLRIETYSIGPGQAFAHEPRFTENKHHILITQSGGMDI